MGILNMFIVILMIIQILTLPLFCQSWPGGKRDNVIRLAGALLICAAIIALFMSGPAKLVSSEVTTHGNVH
jgi:maltose/moltooligosaccharide transporter